MDFLVCQPQNYRVPCHLNVKENQEISCTKRGTIYREWPALHWVLTCILFYTFIYIYMYMLGTTVKLSKLFSGSGVVLTRTLKRIFFLDLGLAVTEINTKKYRNKK